LILHYPQDRVSGESGWPSLRGKNTDRQSQRHHRSEEQGGRRRARLIL